MPDAVIEPGHWRYFSLVSDPFELISALARSLRPDALNVPKRKIVFTVARVCLLYVYFIMNRSSLDNRSAHSLCNISVLN